MVHVFSYTRARVHLLETDGRRATRRPPGWQSTSLRGAPAIRDADYRNQDSILE